MTSDAFRTCRSTGTSCAQCARLGVLVVGGDTLPVWPRMQVLTTALISLTGALGVVGGDTLPDLPRGAAGRAASARVRACTCSQRRPPPPHSRRICTGWARPLPRVRMQVLTTAPISPPQLPTSAYQFRLRLSLRGIDPFQAATQDAILLGPPTGPLLTDGAALSAQLSPAAVPPQPLPTSSSSAVLPH